MTEIKLCSAFDDLTGVVCDKVKGHKGPHEACVRWGDESVDDDSDR